MTKIYISSTYSDLVEHRQQVYGILRKMRYDVIAMEDYVATDERPLDKCRADVASCDLYVGIFVWRYGYIPPGQEQSITELEYRQAGESGLKRLIFLLDEDAPWPRSKMEKGAGREKIKALRAELAAAHVVGFFKDPEELAGLVAASVAVWAQAQLDAMMDSLRTRQAQADRERRAMRARQHVVNVRPLDVAHFKDRLREMWALCDHLADASVRLISVVGRGGMGKTALVSRVLADLERGKLPVPGGERELPIDGILYLSARSTGLGLERIYADVGRMLGEPAASKLAARWADRDMPLAAKVEYLLETIQDGLYLILLDNLEDYLTVDGDITEEGLRLFVERCLTQPGGARLIVTSREEAKITAAALHSARSIPLREGLPEEDAVALLRDLDPQGVLGLRDASGDDLRRAVRLTRGIPRALEILAGILDRDPTASLPKLLADEEIFGEQVVEQLVVEGYCRLGDDERRIMEALAVFDRPVDEAAITYLLHLWFPGLDIRACLRCLVSGYFVSANRVTGEYSLHPLDREYAYRQLSGDEGPDAYNRRNLDLRAADFYVGIRKPESEWYSIEDLAPQLAEFEHRVRAGDYDGACRVLEPIDFDYLRLWGHYARVVDLREKLLGRLTDRSLQTTNLGSLGFAYHYLGQIRQATEFYKRALIITREIGNRRNEGNLLGNLGIVYSDLGQVEQAIGYYQQALAISREVGDRRGEGNMLGIRGVAYRLLGQVERAIVHSQQALAISREIGDWNAEGVWLGNLGTAYRQLGQLGRSIEYYQQALAIARKIGDRQREEEWLGNLGVAYRQLGQLERSIEHCQQSLAISRQIDHQRGEGEWLSNLGNACRDLGQLERALEYYQQALAIAREIGDRRHEGNRLGNLGIAYRQLGQVRRAIEYHEQALAITQEIANRRGEGKALGNLGIVYSDLGQVKQAIEHYQQALFIAREIGDRRREGVWLGYLGTAYRTLERIKRAIEFYEQALIIAREIGNHWGESYQLLGLGKALLAIGELSKARQRCVEALALDVSETSYQAALALGIILLHQRDPDAGDTFADVTARCRAMLEKTAGLYEPRYTLAVALVGGAVCDPRWVEDGEQAELLAPALAEYRRALGICAALGVVRDTLRDLEMIRAAGVGGLGNAFELLEDYVGEGTDVGGAHR
ncbi:MAG: tetratricopeptide repeat protein [Chloroflexi bacterium]|nr:tetratricopeptide repeat protein [Chloroflexota bacterium]